MRTLLLCLVVSAALLARAPAARACATCTCGDPTLTVMGAQQPFEHRLRLSLELLHRSDAFGRGSERRELSEQRTTLGVAYAPLRWLMLSASLPLLQREVQQPSLARDTLWSLGDVELHARGFFYRDREFAPRHLLAAIAGLRLPTAPFQRDASGGYREPELQPGSGSFDPLAGVSYAHFADPFSLYVSEVVYLPTQGRADFRVGASLRGSHAVQYQPSPHLALRLGANFRLDDRTERRVAGRLLDEPDTGGFVLFASPALVWSPLVDLVLVLEVNVPVVNALVGTHDEGIIAKLGGAYDL